VHDPGTKALDQGRKAPVFTDVTPAPDHERRHRDPERAEALNERVVLSLVRGEHRGHVNSPSALPLGQHSDNAFEAALLSRGEDVKYPRPAS
jgi:hypothetical protein